VRIDGNLHARGNWEKTEVRRRNGRAAGFLKLQEPPGGTQLAVRRHTSDVWCSNSRKTLFFVFFTKQEPPSGSLVPPGHLPDSGR